MADAIRAVRPKEAQQVLAALSDAESMTVFTENAWHEVVPNLYLGPQRSPDTVYSVDGSERARETVKLSLVVRADELPEDVTAQTRAEGAELFCFPLRRPHPGPDGSRARILSMGLHCFDRARGDLAHLCEALRKVDASLSRGDSVLIFCKNGSTFSPIVVAAYLMAKYQVTADEAWHYTARRRLVAAGNTDNANHVFLREKQTQVQGLLAGAPVVHHTTVPQQHAVAARQERQMRGDLQRVQSVYDEERKKMEEINDMLAVLAEEYQGNEPEMYFEHHAQARLQDLMEQDLAPYFIGEFKAELKRHFLGQINFTYAGYYS